MNPVAPLGISTALITSVYLVGLQPHVDVKGFALVTIPNAPSPYLFRALSAK